MSFIGANDTPLLSRTKKSANFGTVSNSSNYSELTTAKEKKITEMLPSLHLPIQTLNAFTIKTALVLKARMQNK